MLGEFVVQCCAGCRGRIGPCYNTVSRAVPVRVRLYQTPRIESGTAAPTEATTTKASTGGIELRTPSSTLKEIITIQEKSFQVQLQQSLCSDMRPDTTLVLADIPGVNEAGSGKMYMDYVAQKWDTFDCVVVVMDAVQGVNTEEQVKLLEFVKDKTEKIRTIPVIVLGNKVDHPDDKEVAALVGEVSGKVAQIFGVGCREKALNDVVASVGKGEPACYPAKQSPVFVPLSARNAFLYRTACGLSFEQFRELDQAIIDKIGRSEVPAFKWKKYSQNQKYQVAYEAVSDEDEYAARLEMTNFDKFLKVLSYVIGGKETQAAILNDQLAVKKSKLSWKEPLAPQIETIYETTRGLGAPTSGLKGTFLELFDKQEAFAKEVFGRDLKMSGLSKTMDQLTDFIEVLNPKINEGSTPSVMKECEEAMMDRMKSLVRFQCKLILEKFESWDIRKAAFMTDELVEFEAQKSSTRSRTKRNGSLPPNSTSLIYWKKGRQGWKHKLTGKVVSSLGLAAKPTWKGLSPYDWKTIASCLLLFSHCDWFVEEFGKEKMDLEQMQAECVAILTTAKYGHSNEFAKEFEKFNSYMACKGDSTPLDEMKHRLVVQLDVPDSHTSPSHWGHVVWKYSQFMKRRASRAKNG